MNNCRDCDNKTDGICCHQTIRNKTEVVGDDSAIKHDFAHVEMMQEQRAQKYLFDNINNHERLDGVTEDLGGK